MNCVKCGRDPFGCQCYVWELSKRVDTLEEQLGELTNLTVEMGIELKKYIDKTKV